MIDTKKNPEIKYLYLDEKLSSYEIAERLGISPHTVRSRLRKMDVRVRARNEQSRKSLSKETLQEIEKLYLFDELSSYEISARTGVPHSTITKKLRGFGLTRSRGEATKVKQGKQTKPSRKLSFICKLCHKRKPMEELVQDRRYSPPLLCCKRCAGY